MHILQTIVNTKKKEVAERKSATPIKELESSPLFSRETLSLSAHLRDENRHGIIAEFKRRSPSKPSINLDADVTITTTSYARSGASALSVLTDTDYFGGSNSDLTTARDANELPILRKDFIIDEYQVLEARSIGADAILLISEILTKGEVKILSNLAHSLGMEVLIEMHHINQLDKVHEDIQNVGINNRDLDTFKTDLQTSIKAYDALPDHMVKVAESGIRTPEDVRLLKEKGFQGFLIGEMFMKTAEPWSELQKLVQEL